jgi:hypothetical protein
VFPRLLANSNLLLAVSLLEFQTFRLTRIVVRRSAAPARLRGIDTLFSVLRQRGIIPESVDLWPQVQAAIKIRNVITHASGLIDLSSEATEIERIVLSQTYLTTRSRQAVSDDAAPLMVIERSQAGNALRITNTFVWAAVAYCRDFFIGLCMAAFDRYPRGDVFEEQPRLTLH